ncbi:hypothetical protein C8J57DRAFT_1365874 [Mycena rebaudengoi]|nr:hypothetical protein C8J57DRAFT_1365874 [Mycena rebaudengoi]
MSPRPWSFILLSPAPLHSRGPPSPPDHCLIPHTTQWLVSTTIFRYPAVDIIKALCPLYSSGGLLTAKFLNSNLDFAEA